MGGDHDCCGCVASELVGRWVSLARFSEKAHSPTCGLCNAIYDCRLAVRGARESFAWHPDPCLAAGGRECDWLFCCWTYWLLRQEGHLVVCDEKGAQPSDSVLDYGLSIKMKVNSEATVVCWGSAPERLQPFAFFDIFIQLKPCRVELHKTINRFEGKN